jgi:cytochrome c-type biogenesis protein CcmH/NrfG
MPESTCKKCGHNLKPKDKFCPECGQPVGAAKTARENRLRKDHLLVLGLLAIVAVIYIGYRLVNPDEAAEMAAHQAAQQQQPHGMPQMDVAAFRDQMPTDYPSLVSMGNELMDRGQFALAVECYSRALEIKPTEPDVMVDMGTCQHNLGLNRDAIINFQRALQLEPAHQIAKFNLGIVYLTLEEPDKAVEWWDKLLAENPTGELKERTEMLRRQALGI